MGISIHHPQPTVKHHLEPVMVCEASLALHNVDQLINTFEAISLEDSTKAA